MSRTNNWKGCTDGYDEKKLWGSINPRTGEVNVYSSDVSNRIESAYVNYMTCPEEDTVIIKEFKATVYFKDHDHFIQRTPNGLRSVFRRELVSDENEIELEIDIEYNPHYKSWYLKSPPTTHIGLLVDTSGSMCSVYGTIIEKCLEEFIEKQKVEIKHKSMFYGMTFSDKINTIFNGVDLHKQDKLKEEFYKIIPDGLTAYYDAYLEMIKKIDKQYRLNDEVIICCMTDGQDNSSKYNSDYLKRVIIDRKKRGWIFVMFGTAEVDLDNLDIGIDKSECMEIGLSHIETSNAYKCLNDNINNVRSGASSCVKFSEDMRMASNQNY